MTATTYITSRCLTTGCGWRAEAPDDKGINESEYIHTTVSAHNKFQRGDRLHLDDEAPVQPERAGREGDTQPLPVGNDHPHIHDLVTGDIERRKALGVRRYGQPLQPFNGRNVLQDIYEELLDSAIYMRQLIYEQENPT